MRNERIKELVGVRGRVDDEVISESTRWYGHEKDGEVFKSELISVKRVGRSRKRWINNVR